MRFNQPIAPFLLNFGLYCSMYLLHNMGWPIRSFKLKGRHLGSCALSNVGVFGMKKGFAPLCHISGASIIIAMGKVFKRVCV